MTSVRLTCATDLLTGLVAGQRSPLRPLTPSGTPKSRQGGTPPSAAETLLAYKIYEFVDSRYEGRCAN